MILPENYSNFSGSVEESHDSMTGDGQKGRDGRRD